MFKTTNEYISNNTTTSKMHWKKIANIKWNTIGHSATITSHVTSPKAYTLPQRALYVGNKAICVKYSCTERSKMWILLILSKQNCSSNVKRKLKHTNKQINIEIPKTKTIRIPYLRRPHSRPHKLRLRVTPEKISFWFYKYFDEICQPWQRNFFQGFILTNHEIAVRVL